MKLRFILPIIAIFTLCAATSFAQEKDGSIYIKLYGGYSLLAPGSDYPPAYQFYIPGIGQTGSYTSKGKLGEGFNFGFGLEKDINPLLMAGIDLNYLDGKKNTTEFNTNKGVLRYASSEEENFPEFSQQTNTSVTTHSVLSVIPNVSFKVLKQPNYFIYTKLGVIVTAQTKWHNTSRDTVTYANLANNDAGNYDYKYKYGLNLGMQAAAGVRFNITSRLKGFVELTGNFITVNPTSGYITAYETNRTYNQNYIIIFNTPKYISGTHGNTGAAIVTNSQSGNTFTDTYTSNDAGVRQHINSIVLNVGIAIPIK